MTDTVATTTAKPKRRRYGLIAGILLLVLILLYWLFSSVSVYPIRDLLVQSRDYYEDRYEDLDTLAKALETPEAATAFVHDNISLSIYEGRLQSPDEVLRTRIANPADKALFLAALLERLAISFKVLAAPFPQQEKAGLVPRSEVSEKPLPDAMRKLMQHIGYEGEDINAHIERQASLAVDTLKDSEALVGNAMERARKLVDLDGQSALQPVYLDWVWLEDKTGKIYDPVLPERDRPDIFRAYSASPAKSRIAVSAINAYGEVREMVVWEGNPYGEPVNVQFVPAIDTANRLAGSPDMSDVDLWAPVLSVGAERVLGAAVNKEGDVAPKAMIEALISGQKQPVFEAPEVSKLAIRKVDLSRWPRVRLNLSAVVKGTPNWQSGHFDVAIAKANPGVRIEEPYSTQRNVILLADQSGSTLENDVHQWIKKFGQTFASGISTKQRFAVATFGYEPVFHKLFDTQKPEGYPNTEYNKAWTQPVRGTADFTSALDHALSAILVELGPDVQEETEIILVSDGKAGRLIDQEWRETLAKLVERAKTLKARISPVVMGASEDTDLAALASETGGKLIRITQKEAIINEATDLANRLAGGMAVSFKMPATASYQAGEQVPFKLDLQGYDGTLDAKLTVPQATERRQPGIFLTVNSGGRVTTRPIIALGERYKYQRMAGRYQLYLAAGRYNSNQVLAARLDDWITYYDIKSGNETALEASAKEPRIVSGEMQTINGLVNAVANSLSVEQAVRFPMLVVKRAYAEETDQEGRVAIVNDLDVPAWLPLTANVALRSNVAKAGFVLNDWEARLNNSGTNLTRHFVKATDLNAARDSGPTRMLLANSSLQPESDSLLFRAPQRENLYWHARQTTGQWRGFGLWDDIPLKGSRDVEVAARFARIQSAIGVYTYGVNQSAGLAAALTGASATSAMPAAVALGGFLKFKSEELKLWCYSSIMLGYVNESIAGEKDAILDKSASAAQNRAAKLCKMNGGPEDFAKNAFKEASKGFLDTWANQFEIPQAEDPTANLRDAMDKAERIYKHYYPDLKKGETQPPSTRLERFIGAVDKYGNGDGPSLQSQLVDKAFQWGASSFSPKFRQDLAGAIREETR